MHKCPTYCTVSLASFLKKQANLCPVYSFILICEEGALLWCSGATPGLGTTRYRSMLRFPYAMHALQASEYLPGPYYILLICWFCKYPPLPPPPLPAIYFFLFFQFWFLDHTLWWCSGIIPGSLCSGVHMKC